MKPDDDETQRTLAGEEIPVPKRSDVLRDLRRVTRRKRDESDDDGGAEDQG